MHLRVIVRQTVDVEHVVEVDSATYFRWSGDPGTIKNHLLDSDLAAPVVDETVQQGERTVVGQEVLSVYASGPPRRPQYPAEGEDRDVHP